MVRAHRREQRISQTTLAEAIEVSPQQLQKYETAVNRVAASRLIKIAEVLDVSVLKLLPVAVRHARCWKCDP